MKKTTLYIDIDDDIAAIIDKLEAADQKIVALVLPKRPSALQGSVNLQLLKQSADDSAKSIVLVTTDDQIMQLAGEIGVHVAQTLQSKPFIPSPDTVAELDDPLEEMDEVAHSVATADPAQPDVYAGDQKIDPETPIGELVHDDDEIELDNADPVDENTDKVSESDKKDAKKSIKVPNFSTFRNKLLLGGTGLVLLIGVLVWAVVFAPTADIVIRTEKTDVEGKLTLTAGVATQAVDPATGAVPAVRKEDKQKLTGTFAATGQKDVGERARGTITFRNCEDSDEITIPSGTGVSKGAYTFITQEPVTLEGGTFSGGGSVCTSDESDPVDVVASQPGDQYNLAAGSYTVAGNFGNVRANGSAMGGGTTKIVKVVTQEDIDAAKAKVLETGADNVRGKLAKLLADEGLVAIEDTYTSVEGAPSSSIPVGQEAPSDPTLTIEITSTMLGMKLTDVEPLLNNQLVTQIDTTKQRVYESGAKTARIVVVEKPNADTVKINLIASATVGPNLTNDSVAAEIAGKQAGDAKQYLEALPGVSAVEIDLNPFWVFSVPKNTAKISVTINE